MSLALLAGPRAQMGNSCCSRSTVAQQVPGLGWIRSISKQASTAGTNVYLLLDQSYKNPVSLCRILAQQVTWRKMWVNHCASQLLCGGTTRVIVTPTPERTVPLLLIWSLLSQGHSRSFHWLPPSYNSLHCMRNQCEDSAGCHTSLF